MIGKCRWKIAWFFQRYLIELKLCTENRLQHDFIQQQFKRCRFEKHAIEASDLFIHRERISIESLKQV